MNVHVSPLWYVKYCWFKVNMSVQLKLTLFDIFVGDKSAHSILQCMPSSSVYWSNRAWIKPEWPVRTLEVTDLGLHKRFVFVKKNHRNPKIHRLHRGETFIVHRNNKNTDVSGGSRSDDSFLKMERLFSQRARQHSNLNLIQIKTWYLCGFDNQSLFAHLCDRQWIQAPVYRKVWKHTVYLFLVPGWWHLTGL